MLEREREKYIITRVDLYVALYYILTEVVDGITGFVKCSRVELQPDDGKDEDGEHDQEADLHQGCQSLQDGLQHDL